MLDEDLETEGFPALFKHILFYFINYPRLRGSDLGGVLRDK